MRQRARPLLAPVLLWSLSPVLVTGAVRAETVIVVPNEYELVEAPSGNAIPFNWLFDSHRFQQVFAASEFSALSGPEFIRELALRPDAGNGSAFDHVLPDVQINLSTTSATPATLSATYADNVGADDTVVVSRGPLALSSDVVGPEEGPKAFDIVIPLETPFLYDPAQGNLLLDVRIFDEGGSMTTFFDSPSTSAVIRRVYCPDLCDVTDASGSVQGTGLVTRFRLPEPSATALQASALAALALVRRRRRGAPRAAARAAS
jgi:hypothetical protein